MRRLIDILAFAAALAACISCRRGTTLIYDPEDPFYKDAMFRTLEGQWKYIWQAMDNSYVFWDIDDTDWDALYDRNIRICRRTDMVLDSINAEFNSHNITYTDYKNRNRKEMEDLTEELTVNFESLIDQHLLIGIRNRYDSTIYKIRPSISRLKHRADYHPYLDPEEAHGNPYYEGVDYVFDAIKTSYGVMPEFAADDSGERWAYSCNPMEGIFYLRLSGYFLSDKNEASFADSLLGRFFNGVTAAAADGTLKGIILDNRSNCGGYQDDYGFFPGKFIHEPLKAEMQKTKNGLGRYDYAPYTQYVINPAEETVDIGNAPFVILQDMLTASMGELSGYACSLGIPSAVIIGERSRGATGTLITDYPDIFHTGPVNYNNHEEEPFIYTSTYSTRLFSRTDGEWKCLEGIGIEPDIYCRLDYEGLAAGGRDTQLDCAVQYILSRMAN